MHTTLYQVQLPDTPAAVVFVNGILARDRPGFLWLWRNAVGIYQSTSSAAGCVQAKAGLCGPREIVMVSYWESERDLMAFFRSADHRRMMQFAAQHPDSLCLYNETYRPAKSGKYAHEPQGMALIYGAPAARG